MKEKDWKSHPGRCDFQGASVLRENRLMPCFSGGGGETYVRKTVLLNGSQSYLGICTDNNIDSERVSSLFTFAR